MDELTTKELPVAPEHPFDPPGGQILIGGPVALGQLHTELAAAAGKPVQLAMAMPSDPERPIGPGNPVWLSWSPPSLSRGTVAQVLDAHRPVSVDATTNIAGSDVAQPLQDLREKLSAGVELSPPEVSSALALLLGVTQG